jgi:hypothetical protein
MIRDALYADASVTIEPSIADLIELEQRSYQTDAVLLKEVVKSADYR